MKKFLKFCMIVAVVVLLGGFLITRAWSYGKDPKDLSGVLQEVTGDLIDEVAEGYHAYQGYDINEATMFDRNLEVESGNTDKILDGMNATVLKLELGGCALELETSEQDTTRVTTENAGRFQVYQKGNELNVKATRKAKEDGAECKITLYLPAGYSWDEVDVQLGAGYVNLGIIETLKLEVEVGAGKVTGDGVTAGELELEVGAGEIVMTNVVAGQVEADVDMGNLNLQGVISGNVEARCSMGNITMALDTSVTSYDYELDCVAGSIQLGEEKYGSSAVTKKVIQNGAGVKMDLDCSIGNIVVTFAKIPAVFQKGYLLREGDRLPGNFEYIMLQNQQLFLRNVQKELHEVHRL